MQRRFRGILRPLPLPLPLLPVPGLARLTRAVSSAALRPFCCSRRRYGPGVEAATPRTLIVVRATGIGGSPACRCLTPAGVSWFATLLAVIVVLTLGDGRQSGFEQGLCAFGFGLLGDGIRQTTFRRPSISVYGCAQKRHITHQRASSGLSAKQTTMLSKMSGNAPENEDFWFLRCPFLERAASLCVAPQLLLQTGAARPTIPQVRFHHRKRSPEFRYRLVLGLFDSICRRADNSSCLRVWLQGSVRGKRDCSPWQGGGAALSPRCNLGTSFRRKSRNK